MPKKDYQIYNQIVEELKAKKIDKELWQQAKTSAGEDRDAVKAAYFKLRYRKIEQKEKRMEDQQNGPEDSEHRPFARFVAKMQDLSLYAIFLIIPLLLAPAFFFFLLLPAQISQDIRLLIQPRTIPYQIEFLEASLSSGKYQDPRINTIAQEMLELLQQIHPAQPQTDNNTSDEVSKKAIGQAQERTLLQITDYLPAIAKSIIISTIICALLYTFLLLAIDSLLLKFFGTTPGRKLLGIKVKGAKQLSIAGCIIRALRCWLFGFALFIFPLFIITWIYQYIKIKEDDDTSWDEAAGYRVIYYPVSGLNWCISALLIIIFHILTAVITVLFI